MSVKKACFYILGKQWFRIIVTLIISTILVLSAAKIYSTGQVKEDDTFAVFTAHLDKRIPVIMEDYDIPGANLALVKGGEIVWTKAYGYADIDIGRKMTTKDRIRVQSISKSVTVWGVMRLVEQGEIDLDQPVVKYLKNWDFPETSFSIEKITVRQLLSHTAGMYIGDFMTRYSPEEEIPTLEENLSDEAILINEPGTSFSYSNVGYNVLELLVEEVTGRDFAEYMQQEVLLPLGMLDASFNWSKDFKPPVPNGYNLKGEAIPVYVYSHKASGGLFATVDDIAAFVSAGMQSSSKGQQVINTDSMNAIYTPVAEDIRVYNLVFDAYGFGHYIENLSNSYQAVSHGGQGTGWMTHFHAVPETGDGIVILTNSQRSWPFIAYVLSDWAKWSGFSSVGMGNIILAKNLLWILIGIVWFIVLWKTWGLTAGLILRRRHFAPLFKQSRLLRILQSGIALIILGILIWCMLQDYLMITSVFPITSAWLGILAFAVAAVLMISALFPRKHP